MARHKTAQRMRGSLKVKTAALGEYIRGNHFLKPRRIRKPESQPKDSALLRTITNLLRTKPLPEMPWRWYDWLTLTIIGGIVFLIVVLR